jgi:AcrR family transcriptional regulator
MTKPVKRSYDATNRKAAARKTQEGIISAATRLFMERGYVPTTMAAIADAAGVAVDTVYASVGPKPVLFRLLIERAISGAERPVDPMDRNYVREMRAEQDAGRKLEIYAAATREIQERMAPLFAVLHAAARTDQELAQLWSDISERRARNMVLLAEDLASTGSVRRDLSIQDVADIVWATNASEFYALLVLQRGWSPERFEHWLADSWKRILLEDVPQNAESRRPGGRRDGYA